MRFTLYALLIACGLAAGCDDMNMNNSALPTAKEPDNSAVNSRDQKTEAVTPLDRGQNSADVERTAEIRRKILAISDISINARNAKVVTIDGKVTLRGPVESDAEKDALNKAAIEVAGEGNVVNELEVRSANP